MEYSFSTANGVGARFPVLVPQVGLGLERARRGCACRKITVSFSTYALELAATLDWRTVATCCFRGFPTFPFPRLRRSEKMLDPRKAIAERYTNREAYLETATQHPRLDELVKPSLDIAADREAHCTPRVQNGK